MAGCCGYVLIACSSIHFIVRSSSSAAVVLIGLVKDTKMANLLV